MPKRKNPLRRPLLPVKARKMEKDNEMEGPKKREENECLTVSSSSALPAANANSRAVFILENASLKKGFSKRKWKILNHHEDANFLLKQGKNLNDYRPDIVFEALRGILDSRLNKAGMIGAVYVKTDTGVLFEVKPHARLPRTCKRFCGVILDLLEKKSVRSKESHELLLRVCQEPVTRLIPDNARVVGLSYSSEKCVDIEDYVSAQSDDCSLVFVVGAMVHEKVSNDYTDDYVSVSQYPLSAKYCTSLICEALERKWKIW